MARNVGINSTFEQQRVVINQIAVDVETLQNAGYISGFTESDPVFSASVASTITNSNINNWSNAYSWGDHSLVGYATEGYVDAAISGFSTVGGGGTSFDQDLNTTNDVTFNRIGITTGEINVGSGNNLLVNVESMGQGYTYTFGSGGNANFPGNIEIGSGGYSFFEDSGVDSAIQANPVHNFKIHVGGYNNKVWAFSTDGSLSAPGDITISSGNIGIGTTAANSALWVEGNGRFSGVVTATRFESTSAGTPTIDSPNNLNINAITVAISTDLTVGGDAYVGVDTSSGLVLTSPNGTQYRLVVDNSGNLSTVLVP